jgi:hypothetical protein
LEDDAVALSFQHVNSPACGALSVPAIVVVASQLVVDRAIGQHMVGDSEEGMSEGDDRLLGAAMPQDSAETSL